MAKGAKKKKQGGKKKGGKPKMGPKPAPVQGMPNSKQVSTVRPRPAIKVQHHKAVCSVTDPFCPHARGAQRPDGGPPTVPFQIRFLYPITMDAGGAGTAKHVLVPGVLFTHMAYGTTTSKWDGSGAWTANPQAFVASNMKEARIISFGVVIRSAQSATNAKGTVLLTVDPSPVATVSQQIPKGNMSGTDTIIVPLAAGMEHSWRSKPLGASAHLFKPASNFTSTMSDFDWTSLQVEVIGGDTTASTVYAYAEYVCNIEITLAVNDSTGSAQLTRTPPQTNKLAMTAADVVHANAPSFIEGGITKAMAMAEKYASSALDSVLSDIGSLFVL